MNERVTRVIAWIWTIFVAILILLAEIGGAGFKVIRVQLILVLPSIIYFVHQYNKNKTRKQ